MYLEIDHVSQAFNHQNILHQINFGVKKGHLTALLGPSGSGKTTLLRILAGLDTATAGSVRIDGHIVDHVAPQNRDIGFVFQNYALFSSLTVYENVAFGLRTHHHTPQHIHERVTELLELTGLANLAERYPSQLSGGQRQRVAFARAIAPNPKVLFLDEPFAALDKQIRQSLRLWLKRVIHRLGITSIFVTHDHEEAIETADEIVVMDKGVVKQVGTPEAVYQHPNCQFVAQFIGHSSLLTSPKLTGFQLPPTPYQVHIRPEDVTLYANQVPHHLSNAVEIVTVKQVTFEGALISLTLDLNGQTLHANYGIQQPALSPGDQVAIRITQLTCFKQDQVIFQRNQTPFPITPLKAVAHS